MSVPDQDVTADPGASAAQPQNISSNLRLQHTQAQVDEVVDIMRVNLDTIMDRDKNLSNLDDRADALHSGAKMFESSAAKLKNKYWWKNCKMMIIMGVIVVLLICVAIVYFYH